MLEQNHQDSICTLIERASTGDQAASNVLLPMIYEELRKRAKTTLYQTGCPEGFSTTVLVNEAYLKLFDGIQIEPHCRAQFLAYAASTMRSILIDAARSNSSQKRQPVDLTQWQEMQHSSSPTTLFALDEALDRLRGVNERMAKIVEMRFFAGMTNQEIAMVLDVNERTVDRDWAKARILLADQRKHTTRLYSDSDTQPLG